ncbi:hypothetical protein U1701_12585 [Sphingomonas sp. PB2P19]|uniref:hypothetical protein n=1 Tax=Sphingomonas rhamnosi TaxID=3096156 RepID=UPI002FCA30FD
MLLALLLQAAAPPPSVPPNPCHRVEMHGDTKVIVGLGDRFCVDLQPPRTYEGIWVDYFEGQAFVEGATTLSAVDPRHAYPWFNTENPLKSFERPGFTGRGYVYGHGYKVRFVGRQARDMNRPTLAGYGHLGMSPGLIVLDELLSIEDLGPLNPQD